MMQQNPQQDQWIAMVRSGEYECLCLIGYAWKLYYSTTLDACIHYLVSICQGRL